MKEDSSRGGDIAERYKNGEGFSEMFKLLYRLVLEHRRKDAAGVDVRRRACEQGICGKPDGYQ